MGVHWYRNPGWCSHMGQYVEFGHNQGVYADGRLTAARR